MNEAVGEKKITLGGKEWVLRPSFQAVVEAESISKKSLIELINCACNGTFTFNDVLAATYSCMKAGNASVPSRDEVAQMIFEAHYVDVGKTAFACISLAFRGGKAEEEEKKS